MYNHLLFGFCNTRFVQSYKNIHILPAVISQDTGSVQSIFFIFLTQGQKSAVHAQVLDVDTFHNSICQVVYVAIVGVRANTYVSSPPASTPYNRVQLCDCADALSGVSIKGQAPQVADQAVTSAVVPSSHNHTAHSVALPVAVPVSTFTQDHQIYC